MSEIDPTFPIGIYKNKTQEYLTLRISLQPLDQTLPNIQQNKGSENIDKIKIIIEKKMTDLKLMIDELKNFYRQHLLDINECGNFSIQIEDKTTQIRVTTKELFNNIQALKTKTDPILDNLQKIYATKLQEIIDTFRSIQKKYLADINRQKNKFNNYVYDDTQSIASDEQLINDTMSQSTCEMIEMSNIIQERDQTITSLLRSLEEMNEIFRDINTLIIDQGTLINRIENNVNDAEVHINMGNDELVTSIKLQKRAGNKLICIGLIILIIALIIGLVTYFKLSH
jgi:syntaxin 16